MNKSIQKEIEEKCKHDWIQYGLGEYCGKCDIDRKEYNIRLEERQRTLEEFDKRLTSEKYDYVSTREDETAYTYSDITDVINKLLEDKDE